jgi:hypothetical protein
MLQRKNGATLGEIMELDRLTRGRFDSFLLVFVPLLLRAGNGKPNQNSSKKE